MRSLTAERLASLLAAHQAPCISLYLPTKRAYPETQQNPILFKDLLNQAEELLRQKYPGGAVHSWLDRLMHLRDDQLFWTQRSDGLAVFAFPDAFEMFDLPRRVPPLAVVADSFDINP